MITYAEENTKEKIISQQILNTHTLLHDVSSEKENSTIPTSLHEYTVQRFINNYSNKKKSRKK